MSYIRMKFISFAALLCLLFASVQSIDLNECYLLNDPSTPELKRAQLWKSCVDWEIPTTQMPATTTTARPTTTTTARPTTTTRSGCDAMFDSNLSEIEKMKQWKLCGMQPQTTTTGKDTTLKPTSTVLTTTNAACSEPGDPNMSDIEKMKIWKQCGMPPPIVTTTLKINDFTTTTKKAPVQQMEPMMAKPPDRRDQCYWTLGYCVPLVGCIGSWLVLTNLLTTIGLFIYMGYLKYNHPEALFGGQRRMLPVPSTAENKIY